MTLQCERKNVSGVLSDSVSGVMAWFYAVSEQEYLHMVEQKWRSGYGRMASEEFHMAEWQWRSRR